ncbi:MAG: MBL fold metallo-hydrolase [Bacteroidales bacterium]
MKDLINRISWLGQATVKIKTGDKVLYVDPYMIDKEEKADYIFITHSHYDHFSIVDIKSISKSNTVIYASYDCVPKLIDAGFQKVKGIIPGQSITDEGIEFETTNAYNIRKTTFHPRGNRWMGYIFELEGCRIYHAGDTERIPEMKDFTCDIALLPLGQTYTMNSVEDAAQSAIDVKAKVAIPIHYGIYEGTEEDALLFRKLLKNKVEVIIK